MKLRDRVRGSLLGVAIGDALGAPFENLGLGESNQAIEKMGGSIRDFVPYQNYQAGTWTNDTGMTLATCRALIKIEEERQDVERAFREEFYRWAGGSECRRAGKTVLYSARYRKTDLKTPMRERSRILNGCFGGGRS